MILSYEHPCSLALLSSAALLQFSLRGMLIAMLVVCVALTIYRWPWQEEKLETPFQLIIDGVTRL